MVSNIIPKSRNKNEINNVFFCYLYLGVVTLFILHIIELQRKLISLCLNVKASFTKTFINILYLLAIEIVNKLSITTKVKLF
jgi:presenilin-like A22 family membrane protease